VQLLPNGHVRYEYFVAKPFAKVVIGVLLAAGNKLTNPCRHHVLLTHPPGTVSVFLTITGIFPQLRMASVAVGCING
jgi:hypothetical protein